ncbi:hypothetical protein DRV85_17715 [Rhodosalinus halophilus]|uniref:Uncharacterized protein n=1 Tax=Rhodosalinus halophilus TaxID=2259333 RepID=A0A365U4D9_9RHOB|nr:hypothetical protein [Rhodosalinus halophilus]RBI82865.1 hypothetical protein DRV85_17715 [Rhodosalinus halophilus]
MTDDSLASRILAFARHCGEGDGAPGDTARLRGWLDAAGRPTDEGAALIEALESQDATRSVFRTLP